MKNKPSVVLLFWSFHLLPLLSWAGTVNTLSGYSVKKTTLESYFPHQHFSVNEGLASSTVYFSMQDSKGYVWLLTPSGINRFDGRRFEHFAIDNGLSDNEIFTSYEDSKGRIWFLTYNGKLCYYYGGQFFNPDNYPMLRRAESPSQYTCFLEDNTNGDLWFGTLRNGVIRIRQGKVEHYDIEVAKNKINQISLLFKDAQGRIVVQTQSGKMRFDPKAKLFKLYGERYKFRHYRKQGNVFMYTDSAGLHFERDNQTFFIRDAVNFNTLNINCFYIDASDKLWIGTYNGVFVIENYDRPASERRVNHYLKGVSVGHLTSDDEGNLWCSTLNDGLYFFANHFDKISLSDMSTGLPNNNITSITGLPTGELMLGFETGTIGILRNKNLQTIFIKSSRQTNRIKHLLATDTDAWAATDMGLYRLPYHNFVPQAISDQTSRKYLFFKNNAIYSASSIGLGQLLPNPSGKGFTHYYLMTYPAVTTMNAGNGDTIWFATNKNLMYYDDASGQIGISPLNFRSRIMAIANLPDQSLLIGTAGRGIFQVKAGRIIKRLNSNDGLVSNVCNRIYMPNGRNVWICTDKGLCHLQIAGQQWLISSFTMAEGLPSNEVNDVFVDSSGIYVATNKGLCHFKERDIRGALSPPTLYISEVRAGNRIIENPKLFDLEFHQNNLQFRFAGIAFRYGNQLSYQYKLVYNHREDETEWQNSGNDALQLASLPAGHYTLYVRCRRYHSGWSNIQTTEFTIASPFWQKWWFVVVCGMGFGLVVWRFYNIRIRRIVAKEREKRSVQQRINHLEQQALYAMMNPHFIFNALSSVQHFINNDEKKEANRYLSKFATLLRKNLEHANNSFIPIAEEISSLELYLAIEKLRMGEKLNYQITVSPEIDASKVRIPSMILQPYVENSIWHGLAPRDKRGRVSIIFSKLSNDFLQILVQDNGIGLEASRLLQRSQLKTHKSMGLGITRERIEQISDSSGKRGMVSIEEMRDSNLNVIGTIVVIQLPMRPTFAEN